MRGLFKAFHGCPEVFQMMESGEPAQAQAALVQQVKGLLQVALEEGDWSGIEKELKKIYKYRRVLKEQ
eukprot:3875442-Karenia_brevis.AAC.1